MKKFVLALALAVGLQWTASPERDAHAGLFLTPVYGIGVPIVVFALLYDGEWSVKIPLIFLDSEGNPRQGALEGGLASRYPFIDDHAVIADLASAIRARAAATRADAQGRKAVRLGREQVLEILEPTGLVELEPEKVEGLIADLG